jgi:pyruvate/2-oxoglutarate/acetoin dehydrogenase E1 component
MTSKIEFYVKTEKRLVGQHFSAPVSDGVMTHTCLDKKMLKYERELSQTEKEVIQYLNSLAEKNDLDVEVVDLSTIRGKLKATSTGVKTTPTLIIDHERIENPSMEELKRKLESQFKRLTV